MLIIYENVVIRPFPFIAMKYVTSSEDFNASPDSIEKLQNISFKIPLNKMNTELLKNYLKGYKTKDFNIFEDDLKAAVLATRTLIHNSKGSVRRNINQIITIDKKLDNICSENAKIFAALVQSIGYQSRVVWMCGHTVAEIYHPDSGWILIDPFGNTAFKDKYGNYVDLLTINKDYQNVKPVNIIKRRHADCADYIESNYFQKNKKIVYNDQRCYVALDGNSLFSFHVQHRKVSSILRSIIFGKSTVGKGIQYIAEDSEKFGNFGITFYNRFFLII